MKVNRRSWHYRVLSRIDMTPSRSLCGYFWQVVFACVLLPPLVIALAAWALTPFLWWLAPIEMFPGAVIAASLEIWILCLIWKEHRRELRWKRGLPAKRAKEPSLAAEWLRAKKQKICPLLEFE